MHIQKTGYTTPNVTFNGSIGKGLQKAIQGEIDIQIDNLKKSLIDNGIDKKAIESKKEYIATLKNYYYEFKDIIQQTHSDIVLDFKLINNIDDYGKIFFRDKTTEIEKGIYSNYYTGKISRPLEFFTTANQAIKKVYSNPKDIDKAMFYKIVEETHKTINAGLKDRKTPYTKLYDYYTTSLKDLEKRGPEFIDKLTSDQNLKDLKRFEVKILAKKKDAEDELKVLKEIEELKKSSRLD